MVEDEPSAKASHKSRDIQCPAVFSRVVISISPENEDKDEIVSAYFLDFFML